MEENFNLHLGKKLRMRRLSLGLTQTKVANAINVHIVNINMNVIKILMMVEGCVLLSMLKA